MQLMPRDNFLCMYCWDLKRNVDICEANVFLGLSAFVSGNKSFSQISKHAVAIKEKVLYL